MVEAPTDEPEVVEEEEEVEGMGAMVGARCTKAPLGRLTGALSPASSRPLAMRRWELIAMPVFASTALFSSMSVHSGGTSTSWTASFSVLMCKMFIVTPPDSGLGMDVMRGLSLLLLFEKNVEEADFEGTGTPIKTTPGGGEDEEEEPPSPPPLGMNSTAIGGRSSASS